jgi:hypothetical protein
MEKDPSASTIPQLISIYTDITGTPTGFSWGTVFSLPLDGIFRVLNEKVIDSDGNTLTVIPISNKDFDTSQSKPYHYPRRRTAFRLGVLDSTSPSIEVFGRPNTIVDSYHLRYVRKPKPIIVDDLDVADSIDGYYNSRTSELDIALHRDILKVATTLAEQYYYDKYGTSGNQRQD